MYLGDSFHNIDCDSCKWTKGCFIYILDSSNLVQSHFELVSLVLALEATELLSEPVTQMAVELINNHIISV